MRLVGQHLPDRYVQGWRIGKVRDEPEVRRVAGEGCVEPYLSNLITWQHLSTARDLNATTEAPKRDSVANRLWWLDLVSSPLFPPLSPLLPTRIGPRTLGA